MLSISRSLTDKNAMDRQKAARAGVDIRRQAREAKITSSTTDLAKMVMCNMAVLAGAYASDFLLLCRRNPVCLLLIEKLPAGNYESGLAAESHALTDLPGYNLYRDGILIKEGLGHVKSEWDPDHTGFLIGCSFTFKSALADAGLAPRSIVEKKEVDFGEWAEPAGGEVLVFWSCGITAEVAIRTV